MNVPLVGPAAHSLVALERTLASEFAGLRLVPASTADLGPATRLVIFDLASDDVTRLRASVPSATLVALASDTARGTVIATLRAGAAGFIETAGDLGQALRVVLEGGVWLPPAVIERRAPDRPGYGTWVPAAKRPEEAGLSPEEAQVLKLLIEGQPNARIALVLAQPEPAIEALVQAVYRRLDANARLPAVLAVARMGLRLGIGR